MISDENVYMSIGKYVLDRYHIVTEYGMNNPKVGRSVQSCLIKNTLFFIK